MTFSLMALPYEKNSLEPYISEETLNYHYEKHHQTYVNNLNNLLEEAPELQGKSLEEIIMNSSDGMFNNAAQVWNHDFYWNSLCPANGQEAHGNLLEAINKEFENLDNFREIFTKTAVTTFGSGWAWLVKDNSTGKLEIMSTSNADTPMKHGKTAILTCDVWEHAYYIDYRNVRPKYVESFWNLVNWDFAEENFNK